MNCSADGWTSSESALEKTLKVCALSVDVKTSPPDLNSASKRFFNGQVSVIAKLLLLNSSAFEEFSKSRLFSEDQAHITLYTPYRPDLRSNKEDTDFIR